MNNNEPISQTEPTPVSYDDLVINFLRLADEIHRRSGKRVIFTIGEENEEPKKSSEQMPCEAPPAPSFDNFTAFTRDRLHDAASDLNFVLMDAMGHGERTMDRRLQEALLLFADAISAQRG